ncbi:MAG: hypothetical protein F4Y44_03200 [Chloroflexi bacterium]|nr:hypothetical protein [Chloroflexota bacterium]
MTNSNSIAVTSRVTGDITLHDADKLGEGGEGAVYSLPEPVDEWVAKVYHRDKLTDETIRKLEMMIDYPPERRDEQTGHLFVSWPSEFVFEAGTREIIGFLMPKVDTTGSLFDYYTHKQRKKKTPHIHYRNLCSVAKSIAIALDR